MGCEDGGRIGKVGDTFVLPYTAVGLEEDNVRIRIAQATSEDGRIW